MILLFWFPIQGLICIWLNTKATYQKLLELYNSASLYVTYVKKWFIAISYLTIHSSNIQIRSQISAKFASIKVQNLTLFSQIFFRFFFFFRLFWGLSWFDSKPIFTMSAVWAWDGSHLTSLYCWFNWKAQENQQTIQMNR